jgi:hypothetical protein
MPGHTKAEKRRLLESIRAKSVKLYIAGVLPVKDVEAISRIVMRADNRLK